MTALRRHPLTGEPILFAPERAGRPNAFGDAAEELCPFCPGNESFTPPTIAALGHPWRIRAFANKYPAIDGHEVLVESSRHDDTFATLADAESVVQFMLERYAAHGDAAHVALFKNHGAMAGASLEHPHSQLIPLPFVPPRIAAEAAGFVADCPLCEPHALGEAIAENEHFVWLAPHASRFAYQQWLVPKHHAPEPAAAEGLGAMLQLATRAMLGVANAYNWSFVTFRGERRAHWYVDLFPRLTTVAGFELGTGTFIEIIDPAATARKFRP